MMVEPSTETKNSTEKRLKDDELKFDYVEFEVTEL